MKRPRLPLFFDSPINSLSLGDGESLQMVRGPQVRTLVGTRKRREGLSPFCHPRWLPAVPLMLFLEPLPRSCVAKGVARKNYVIISTLTPSTLNPWGSMQTHYLLIRVRRSARSGAIRPHRSFGPHSAAAGHALT